MVDDWVIKTMYATKRRRKNPKCIKPLGFASRQDQPTKSNPSKRHRERLNSELEHLASLLPFEQSVIVKLDKLSILRLAVSFLRIKCYFQCLDKEFTSQADILHQSVLELIHSEDREEFRRQLSWQSFLPPEVQGSNLGDLMNREYAHHLRRRFTVRFRCLLDNTSGFITLELTGRLQFLHGQSRGRFGGNNSSPAYNNHSPGNSNRNQGRQRSVVGTSSSSANSGVEYNLPPLGFFAVCSPLGPMPSLNGSNRDVTFKTKHKLDLSLVNVDSRTKMVFDFTEADCQRLKVYDLVHPDDLYYVARGHKELFKTGSIGFLVHRWLDKSGAWIWLQSRVKLMLKNGKQDHIIAIHRQMTIQEGMDLLIRRSDEYKLPFPLLEPETLLGDDDSTNSSTGISTSNTSSLELSNSGNFLPKTFDSNFIGPLSNGGGHLALTASSSTRGHFIHRKSEGDSSSVGENNVEADFNGQSDFNSNYSSSVRSSVKAKYKTLPSNRRKKGPGKQAKQVTTDIDSQPTFDPSEYGLTSSNEQAAYAANNFTPNLDHNHPALDYEPSRSCSNSLLPSYTNWPGDQRYTDFNHQQSLTKSSQPLTSYQHCDEVYGASASTSSYSAALAAAAMMAAVNGYQAHNQQSTSSYFPIYPHGLVSDHQNPYNQQTSFDHHHQVRTDWLKRLPAHSQHQSPDANHAWTQSDNFETTNGTNFYTHNNHNNQHPTNHHHHHGQSTDWSQFNDSVDRPQPFDREEDEVNNKIVPHHQHWSNDNPFNGNCVNPIVDRSNKLEGLGEDHRRHSVVAASTSTTNPSFHAIKYAPHPAEIHHDHHQHPLMYFSHQTHQHQVDYRSN